MFLGIVAIFLPAIAMTSHTISYGEHPIGIISIPSFSSTFVYAEEDDFYDPGAAATSADADITTEATAAAAGTPTALGSKSTADTSSGLDSPSMLTHFLGNLILSIASAFVWVGGHVLDSAINNLVFKMGEYINDVQFGHAIDTIWTVIRDFSNLAFIFGFIFLGVRTIIDPESASVKRTLTRLVIGALLINFSLYIVKFVVDFSNLLAFHIYNAMVTGSGTISAKLMDMLGLISVYGTSSGPESFRNITANGMIWFYVLAALLLFIAAFVFIAAGILLAVRFVALIFIMIASPLLFAATVFPQTESVAKKLWSQLISYSLFAPAYLLLTLISITLMGALTSILKVGGSDLGKALQNQSAPTGVDSYGVVISFIVMIFFLIESLLIAKKIGIAGADTAVSIGSNLRKGAQGYLGRGAVALSGASFLKKKQESLRNSNSRWAQTGALAMRATGINAAAGAATSAKFGSGQSYDDKNKEQKEVSRKRAQNAQIDTTRSHISGAIANPTDATKKIAMERSISGASSEQVLSMADSLKGAERDMFIENLSASQFDTLMKSKPEDFDDAKKKDFKDVRAKLLMKRHNIDQNTTTGGVTTNSGAGDIGKADAKELESMDFAVLLKHANHLSMKQIDDMKDLTPTAKSSLKDARKSLLLAEFNAGAGAGSIFRRISNETEQAKLPRDILKDSASAPYLTQGVLTKMLDNDSVLPTDRITIRQNVETAWLANPTKQAKFIDFFDNTPAGKQYI